MSLTWKRRIANWVVRGIEQTSIAIVDGHELRFVCPDWLRRSRVETFAAWEPATMSWIRGFAPGAVMWDIGAKTGISSLYAARARGCRVVAFEAGPQDFALLVRNVQINGLEESVSAFSIVLADNVGVVVQRMPAVQPGGRWSVSSRKVPAAATNVACFGFSIDQFIDVFGPPFPEHVKIDAAGLEEEILRGAQHTLADPRVRSVSIKLDDRRPESWSHRDTLARLDFYVVGAYRSPRSPLAPTRNFHFRKR
jgi:FkbM family methyltransferase